MDFNALITAIATNGIGGICAAAILWFAYYRETHSLPEILATFKATTTEMQHSFELRNTKTLDLFTEVMRGERALCQQWHEEQGARLDRLFDEAKANRHTLNDVLHQVGMAHAVEAERQKRKGRGEPPFPEKDT